MYIFKHTDIKKVYDSCIGHSSEQCKLINDLGTSHAESRTFKQFWEYPTFAKKYNKKKEVNYIVRQGVDDILQED